MNKPNPDRVAEIFAAALEKTETERHEFIAAACGDDALLCARVLELIGALPEPELLFESPAFPKEIESAATVTLRRDPGRSGQILGHYRLQELLGSGGMGEVYRAEDLALGKLVAIKVLRPGANPQLRARLLKESVTSAKIEHPAVATFYEVGKEEEVDYLAMEYVEGETLRDYLRQGTPPANQAIALVFALLDALVHAHAKGIVHRDIKPENIMVTPEGFPKLLDFGIAKEVHLPESRGEAMRTATMLTSLTGHGFIVGTIGYMSPEQLRGEVVSEQTDVFAMGAVLYELLTGEAAFPGSSVRERMAATFSREIPHLDLAEVHVDINAVLRKALARSPEDRYASAAAFIRDLKDVGSGVSLAMLPNTVAILDLENLARTEIDDWIGSGVAESLGADLGRMTDLDLVPRNKVLRAAANLTAEMSSPDPVALGLTLGCRWVLTGTYQRMGSRLRLTVRLVEVATGADRWVEKLDGELDQIFEMQDRLARITAKSLGVVIPEAESRPQKFSAYEYYAKGRKLWTAFRSTDMPLVRELYTKAIEIDPDYAPALAGLACIYAPSMWSISADPALLAKGEQWARRALQADSKSSDAQTFLGYSLWRQGKLEAAARALAMAEELDAKSVFAPYFRGALMINIGQWEGAVLCLRRAFAIDEGSIHVLVCLGFAYTELGHYSEAEWALFKAQDLERAGNEIVWGGAGQLLSDCFLRQGRLAEAWDVCKELLASLEGNEHTFRSSWRMTSLRILAEIAYRAGDTDAAEVAVNQSIAMTEAQPEGPSKGQVLVQALALKSMIGFCRESYLKARELEKSRSDYDFAWGPIVSEDRTLWLLAQAAQSFEEWEEATTYYARAQAAGCLRPLQN